MEAVKWPHVTAAKSSRRFAHFGLGRSRLSVRRARSHHSIPIAQPRQGGGWLRDRPPAQRAAHGAAALYGRTQAAQPPAFPGNRRTRLFAEGGRNALQQTERVCALVKQVSGAEAGAVIVSAANSASQERRDNGSAAGAVLPEADRKPLT